MAKKGNTGKDEPRIGIFWFVEDQLVVKTAALSEVPVYDGIHDIDTDHFSYWDQWTATCRSDLIMYSYDHFPRGRIVYREADKKYVIFGDRCVISNKNFISRLRNAFGLSPRMCVVMSDGHYQCHRCNPSFLSDSAIFDE